MKAGVPCLSEIAWLPQNVAVANVKVLDRVAPVSYTRLFGLQVDHATLEIVQAGERIFMMEVQGAGSIRYGKNFSSKLVSNTSLNTIEKTIAKESNQILNSSEFKKITDGFANKTPVQIEINGRTISYDDAPFSGMTWFEKNGFNIGREAFISEEELIKTVLHEMYRLKTSTLRGSGSSAQVSQETKAAFDYANKTFNLFE